MYKTKVIPILTGTAQTFLLIQNGKFGLVDSGNKNKEKKVVRAMTSRGLKIEDLRFIFLTHTHYDHTGTAASMKKLSGAPIIVHRSEADFLRKGFNPIPNGTNPFTKFIVRMGRKFTKQKFAFFQAAEPDFLFEEEFDLREFGFHGKIIKTPGHTIGSSTLLVDRLAFVGDTLFNVFGAIYPTFANDEIQLKKSWKLLMEMDIDYFYPAHGKRIRKAALIKAAQKKKII